jgi:hypothetical protein
MPTAVHYGVDHIRRLAQQRRESVPLRALAEEIGISHGALDAFLKGSKPNVRTWPKLQAWYPSAARRSNLQPPANDLDLATEFLLDNVRAAPTRRVAEARVKAIADKLKKASSSVPDDE